DTYPILLSFTHCGNKSILRVLRIILVILPEHPSETKVFHNEDGNPARANIKQALGRMFPEESDKIEKYVDGLHDMIHRSVMASKPKTMHDAIEFATELMDKKISTFAECQAYNKRKFDDTSRNNQNQQQQNKSVLLNATSEIKLAIWPMTIRVLQMPILLTTKGALGQVRKLLALSAKPSDILRGSVQRVRVDVGITIEISIEDSKTSNLSKRYHVVPYGELNGIPEALMARFGVVSKSTEQSPMEVDENGLRNR
ncbi:hypothetical protein Tco_1307075, partial [Tanacetum coccineum]